MTNYLPKLSILGATLICVGCTTVNVVQPPVTAISNSARQQVNVLAVRGPHPPSIHVSGDEIARRAQVVGAKAKEAGFGSISAGFEAGAEAGEPLAAIFMATLGIAAAPFAAAGGAIYGGAISDNDEDIKASVPKLRTALGRAASQMERQLKLHTEAADLSGFEIEYVTPSTSNQALRDRGFDAVLDVKMKRLDTMPSENLAQVRLVSRNTVSLTDLDNDALLAQRDYQAFTDDKKFSTWVDQDAAPLFEALDVSFAEISVNLIDDFFRTPSMVVEGLEPIATDAARRGRIDGVKPLILWQTLDANVLLPDDHNVEYELLLYTGSKPPAQGIRLTANRYVPEDLLKQCKRYRWKVRAHYRSFNQPVASPWSPEYRFGTPCN